MPKEQDFAYRLIAWQRAAGRHDLPWQQTRDPYRVWLSEIMLQQTQVATVIPYYQRFVARFPEVATLAAAPVEAVIEHWAGLGYYARARNLHRCAQQVMTAHGGRFPETSAALAELPGIGRSTAAAIAAFCFGERTAILDGNVKRVLCRVFGIEGFPGLAAVDRKLWALAETLLPDSDIAAYTQGLMDLGATCCTRHRPQCANCPMHPNCVAAAESRQHLLPTPRPRAPRPERRENFVLISDGQHLLLERRPPSGLWGGLLVPPTGETGDVLAARGLHAIRQQALGPIRHAFTHFQLTLDAQWVIVEATGERAGEPGREWVDLGRAAEAGVPTPIARLIRQIRST